MARLCGRWRRFLLDVPFLEVLTIGFIYEWRKGALDHITNHLSNDSRCGRGQNGAMANSQRNQPVASKLWLSSSATNRGRGKCGRWVLKE
jgi:hypothetical protein